MNLKIEDHEQEVEHKVKERVKNIVATENLQWAEAPKDYEKIIQKLEVQSRLYTVGGLPSNALCSLCVGRSAQPHLSPAAAEDPH